MRERVLKVMKEYSIEDTDLNLFEEGYLDSLTLVNVVVDLEEEFDIDIRAELVTADNFKTIDAITVMVRSLYEG